MQERKAHRREENACTSALYAFRSSALRPYQDSIFPAFGDSHVFAGLPGTGIGGIFYLLLTLWMPINEFVLTIDGRSSWERWRFIAGRWAIFALVVLVMWAQVRLLKGIFPQGAPESATAVVQAVGINTADGSASGVLLGSSLYAAMVMFVVIALVHLVRALRFYRVYLRDLMREFA